MWMLTNMQGKGNVTGQGKHYRDPQIEEAYKDKNYHFEEYTVGEEMVAIVTEDNEGNFKNHGVFNPTFYEENKEVINNLANTISKKEDIASVYVLPYRVNESYDFGQVLYVEDNEYVR